MIDENKKNVVVSIIVPVFNSEKYLQATLHSLQQQTFKYWEAICVDDGSSDRSAEIVRSLAFMDGRFNLVLQSNSGPGAARNKGLSLASGKYFVFQDSDDLLHPEFLEHMVAKTDCAGADIAICDYEEIDEDSGQPKVLIRNNVEAEVYADSLPERLEDWRKFRGHVWGKLYKKQALSGIHFSDLLSSEDTLFNIDVFSNSAKIVYIDKKLYYYRKRRGSLTSTAIHHRKTIEAGLAISLHCIKLYESGKITKTALQKLVRTYGTNAIFLHVIIACGLKKLSLNEKRKIIDDANRAIDEVKSNSPKFCYMISGKYFPLYQLLIRPRNLVLLSAIAWFRLFLKK